MCTSPKSIAKGSSGKIWLRESSCTGKLHEEVAPVLEHKQATAEVARANPTRKIVQVKLHGQDAQGSCASK